MSDEDEFEKYDLSEFTEQELADALAHAHGGPAVQIAMQDSPFDRFLSWKKHLAVTDIVSPLWCEVQHEYSLYGKRHKPVQLRPSTFTSRNGKQIRVLQQVARANDRRLKRGKSVHKALEDELAPEKLVVRPVSDEERFGLRLLQLIDGFNQLVTDGITRELPVFAITHAQVVLGVIDEVLLTQDLPPEEGPPTQVASTIPYELRILDYKTRRSSSIPLDEDALSSRIQLMMYHRMLSALLEPEAFDFDLLWNRLKLDPLKPFSARFLKDVIWEQRHVDPADVNVHLSRLVSEWISAVQRKPPGFVGVGRQLQIVYRRSVLAGKQRGKGRFKATEIVDVDDPLEALVLHEELDIARAIEESLIAMGHQEAGQVAHHVAQNVKQASSIGSTPATWKDLITPSDSGQDDPMLTWAIQQSLLACAHEACAQVPANRDLSLEKSKVTAIPGDEGVQDRSTAEISPIIGTKEFNMDDGELDARLTDVLQWWFGARPARGVDVSQTNRCFTCEYQDSCEWRERKAREATARSAQNTVMDGWVDYLHVEFLGEHILFRFLRLHSFWSFVLSSIVIAVICLLERLLTLVLNKYLQPSAVRRSRLATAAWRSSLYGCVTFLRLLYMLIAMSNQLGAIATVVITLSMGQFAIEFLEYQEPNSDRLVEEPLLGTLSHRAWRPVKRPRARSKPDSIFIHPHESNLARADAVALELGIASDTELVQGNKADGKSWQLGKGRDVARETLGHPHRRLNSDAEVFDVADDDGEGTP